MSNGTLVEQPSPEVCSQPPYILIGTVGMARTGYCGKMGKPSEAQSRTTVKHAQEHSQRRAGSLRVAVVFVVIIIVLFAVAFVFLFFLVWLLSKEDIGSYRPIRMA